ncbi:hypothetical protein COX84_04265 [Candidatus Micrarchaeota archaeon CG_4_10_14_0_2_um_filter_49_7]|nr:MAG: hypothetical protein AUJ13_01370 [Candidatus Micrarchaeota archaeon CG1_02_49_24]PIU81383.1 MAG: hypothetical protein COS70_04370 [Candidatus Micrarchaeota archaeon CG06_land_8_20_14_3_00_50_6]PIZ95712.1 MAG: hypothetical protein COX84_04265 [Candidatus Micrarchaeota archaeon CG_4_10_14_0_2_um_filter_49_7]
MLQVRTQQWYADAQRHANALAARFHGQSAERRIDVFVEMHGWVTRQAEARMGSRNNRTFLEAGRDAFTILRMATSIGEAIKIVFEALSGAVCYDHLTHDMRQDTYSGMGAYRYTEF